MSRSCPYLHKRGNVFYFFRRDSSDKRFEESLRTTDLQTAKDRYHKRTQEIESGNSPNDSAEQTLQQACSGWLEQRQFRVSRGSLLSERSIVRNLLAVFGADSRLRSLADVSKVRHYQNERLKVGISAKTINNEIQILRSLLESAQLWQRVERDYKRLHVQRSDVPDALTQEESLRLLHAAARASRTAVAPWVAVLAFSTGMRSGEIKPLQLGDLHECDEFPYLVVRRQTTKTDAGARRVALDGIALTALAKLRSRSELMGSVRPTDCLLPTDRGRHTRSSDPLHGGSGFDPRHPQSSWESEWKRFRKTAGISHRRFHDLRHTYISRAAEAGVPTPVVEAQVGHMGADMVRWYTHISTRAQYKAACQIEAHSPELLRALSREEAGKIASLEGASRAPSCLEQPLDYADSRRLIAPSQQIPRQNRCRALVQQHCGRDKDLQPAQGSGRISPVDADFYR